MSEQVLFGFGKLPSTCRTLICVTFSALEAIIRMQRRRSWSLNRKPLVPRATRSKMPIPDCQYILETFETTTSELRIGGSKMVKLRKPGYRRLEEYESASSDSTHSRDNHERARLAYPPLPTPRASKHFGHSHSNIEFDGHSKCPQL
jgi:hypothetical protein